MWRRAFLACAFMSCGLAGCKGRSSTEAKIPQEEVERKNPIESTPSSISEGKYLYGATDCALCHGKNGDGKGVLAKDIRMNLRDWKNPASLAHFTDGELSYLIEKGKGRMPAYEKRETPDQVWEMINYIRSLPANGATPKS
jgi:mono/diheme cytochrome c family protein